MPRVLLAQLSYDWGNERFAAGPEFLAAVVGAARRSREPILECGCGLSTLALGIEAVERGLEVYALEDDRYWARRTRRALERDGIECVTVLEAPLRSYGSFIWYDPPRSQLPSRFSLIVCDGPPAERGGRFGLLPILYARLDAGAEILLDDAARPGEQRIILRWVNEFGLDWRLEGVEKPFAWLRLPDEALSGARRPSRLRDRDEEARSSC